jgi:hypothetical protein
LLQILGNCSIHIFKGLPRRSIPGRLSKSQHLLLIIKVPLKMIFKVMHSGFQPNKTQSGE